MFQGWIVIRRPRQAVEKTYRESAHSSCSLTTAYRVIFFGQEYRHKTRLV